MEAYEQLASDLKSAGIIKSSMFGMPVLKLGRKPICGWWEDGVNFKLKPDSDTYKLALSLEGSRIFQPVMKNGRVMTMKNWIVVPATHAEYYRQLAQASIEIVAAES